MSTGTVPFVESVVHPTDLSKESHSAFAHALAIALLRQTELVILHASPDAESWAGFPAVRETLERWGVLAPGSPRSAVFDELEMRVKKTTLKGSTPLRGILTYLEESPADLIVLATAGRQGMPRWLRSSVAEPIARESRTLSLFVPTGARGFVDLETGRLSLRRVLLPVDHEPAPQEALIYCTRAAAMLGEGDVEITLLHVGEEAPPKLSLPEDAAWTFRRESRRGDPIDEIIAAAHETGADLVCMATAGRQGVLDALRGSTTEQVLRRISCPLLAVPSL